MAGWRRKEKPVVNGNDTNAVSGSGHPDSPFPLPPIGQAVQAISELHLAALQTLNRIGSNAVENWAPTEKELLKWQKSIVFGWADVADRSLRKVQEIIAAEHAVQPSPAQ